MKRGKVFAGIMVPFLLLNSLFISTNAAVNTPVKKQNTIEKVSNEYHVSQDLIQKELNKGYRIDEIRKALDLIEKSGKGLDETLSAIAVRPARPDKHVKASVAASNPTKTENVLTAQTRLTSTLTAMPLTSTSDPSTVDLNKTFDQAPFTITAGQNEFSTMTGSTYVNESDLTLLGRNGLNFVLKRDYDSESAQLFDVDYTANPLKTNIKYDSTVNYMGPGWRMEIPSVEVKTGTSTSYIVHMANGGSYTADLTNSKLIGYAWKDVTFRRDTTSDSGGNGYFLTSTTNNLKYYFNSKGKLLRVKDMFGNTMDFTYSSTTVNYLDFTGVADGAINSGYPLKKVTSSNGNVMTFDYLPATSTEPQHIDIKLGDRQVTYKFTPRDFPTSKVGETIIVPLLTEVDDPLGNATIYNYDHAYEDNAWGQTTGTNQQSIRNPYALVTSIAHPTGAKTFFEYPQVPTTIISGTTANDIFQVSSVYDQFKLTDGTLETDNRMMVMYDGNMCRLMSDGTFKTIVTDDLGRKATYQYKKDSLNNNPFYKMVMQTVEKGDTVDSTSYAYDETNKYPSPIRTSEVISSKTNAAKTVTLNTSSTYDAYTNLTKYTNALGQTLSNTFDATNHWLTKQVDNLSSTQYKQVEYSRDNRGAATSVKTTDQAGTLLAQVDYTYDSFGNITKLDTHDTGNTIYTTTKTYDISNTFIQSITAQVTDPDDIVSTYTKTYETNPISGEVTKFFDAKNQLTSYSYDKLGRITDVFYPDKTSVSMKYLTELNQIEQTYSDGTNTIERTLHKWDPLGRETENGLYENNTDYQAKVSYEYDKYGHKKSSQDAKGNKTEYTYDLSDRVTSEISDVDNSKTTYQYDDVNLTKTTVTPDGYSTMETYDNAGRTVKNEVLSASGTQVTAINTYDYAGNVLTATDGNNNVRSYQYDAQSHLISVTTPDNQTTTYTYDMRGNVIQVRDPKGNITTDKFDELGGVIEEKQGNATFSEKSYYDANHNLVRHVDYNGQVTVNEYDVRNKLIKSTAGNDVVQYQYDALGRRSQVTDATGTTVYSYTSDNKVKTIKLPDNKTVSFTYDANGNRSSMKDPFDEMVYYEYDAHDQLQTVKSGSDTNAPDASYTYSAEGVLQSYNLGNIMTFGYTYDSRARVASMQQNTLDGTVLNSYQHEYDGNGNLTNLTINNTTSTFTYDNLNRISSSSNSHETYSYDQSGNRKTMYSDQPVLPTANNYEYDTRNQLKKVTTSDGKVVTYLYNADGLLYERTENGETTRYYYDGDEVIAEAAVSGSTITLKARYLRDLNNRLIARVDANGSKAYYVYNSHGDISELRDANGSVLNRYSYDTWGNPLTTTETVSNPFRYTGEMWDSSTSLLYLRARWYDPSQGRFINEDTFKGHMDNPMSLNLFTYVQNNPLTHTDPTGHMQDGDEKYKGTQIYDELMFLTTMYVATDEPASKAQIHAAADELRRIGDSGDPYTIIRSKAFIDDSLAQDPVSKDCFNGNPNGRGANSIDCKTLQYVVVDNWSHKVTVAGFVGQTIDYTSGDKKRAHVSGLTYSNSTDKSGNTVINLSVDVADPLVSYAAPINDNLTIKVSMGGSVTVSGKQDGFPAHEIWVSNGSGTKNYTQLYGYYGGSLVDLIDGIGDVAVSGNFKN